MKKFTLIIIGFLSSFFCNWNLTQAKMTIADFTPLLDKRVASMKTTEEKVKFLTNFSNLLTDKKFTTDKDAPLFEQIRNYSLNMLTVFEYQLIEEQSSNKTSSKATSTKATAKSTTKSTTSSKATTIKETVKSLPHLSDNFGNIDEDKVREAILSRHNEERENVGVNDYVYNLDLEGSATVWANKLVNSGKTKNLHVRNSGDGTYSYTSILNWFSGLGINFPTSIKGAASFSESIGYGYYKCSSSDCTQSLINAAKKTRTNLIMAEKSYNGDHYRAAVMKHFTQMGAGLAIDKTNNRYYIVLHYGVDF